MIQYVYEPLHSSSGTTTTEYHTVMFWCIHSITNDQPGHTNKHFILHLLVVKHCDIYYQKLVWQLFKFEHYSLLTNDLYTLVFKINCGLTHVRWLFEVSKIFFHKLMLTYYAHKKPFKIHARTDFQPKSWKPFCQEGCIYARTVPPSENFPKGKFMHRYC